MTTAVQELDPSSTPEQVDRNTGEIQESQQLAPRTGAAAIGFGMSARSWDEGLRIARQLAKSNLVPKAFFDKDYDIVVAMQMGAEIGLAPMQSLQSIAVINGKPGVYGDGFLAVIKGSPLCVGHVEWWEVAGERKPRILIADLEDDATTAVCAFWRRGQKEPYVNSFSVGDAKKAGLWSKGGNWATYPQRMLMWRARSWAGRDGFPDVLRGIGMAEELADITAEVINVEAVRPGLPAEPVRRSEKALAAGQPAAATDPVLTTELPPESSTRQAAPPTETRAAGNGSTTRAAAASTTRKPDSTSQAGNGPSVTTESLAITETAYVEPKTGESYWEVKAIVRKDGASPIGFVFVTKDEALFKMAESCEGTDATFNIRWHGGKRQDGSACKILEAIGAAN